MSETNETLEELIYLAEKESELEQELLNVKAAKDKCSKEVKDYLLAFFGERAGQFIVVNDNKSYVVTYDIDKKSNIIDFKELIWIDLAKELED